MCRILYILSYVIIYKTNDVTAQGVDEHMINVHCYYYYYDIITSIVNTSTGADDNN